MGKSNVRLLVVGIDGMEYEAARRYLSRSDGPLGEASRSGTLARLRSTIPPNSASAWSSIFTGTGPGRHGVYQFSDRKGGLVSSLSLRVPTLWEILSYLGMKSVVVNVPMTWPPTPLLGRLVSGLPAPTSSGIVFPPGEDKIIPRGYVPDLPGDPFVLHGDRPERAIEEAVNLEKQKLEVFRRALDGRSWDLAALVFTVSDRASHLFWMAGEPGPHVMMTYEAVESMIEEALEWVEYEHLLVVSDHGFYGSRRSLLLLNWMIHSGLYSGIRGGLGSWLAGLGRYLFDSSSLARAALPKLLRAASRLGVSMHFREEFGSQGRDGVTMGIGGRFVAISGRGPWSPMSGEALKIARALEAEGEREGLKIVRDIHDPRDLYSGPRVGLGPDLVIEIEPDFVIRPGLTLDGKLTSPLVCGGSHELYGVLIASERLEVDGDARVEDVTPTALGMLGLAPPAYMEGRDLYAQGSGRASLPDKLERRSLLLGLIKARLGLR